MNGFRVVLLDMKWKLFKSDPFSFFFLKDFKQFYGENCFVFQVAFLIRTIIVFDWPPIINTHIYLGMFEFIFGQ